MVLRAEPGGSMLSVLLLLLADLRDHADAALVVLEEEQVVRAAYAVAALSPRNINSCSYRDFAQKQERDEEIDDSTARV